MPSRQSNFIYRCVASLRPLLQQNAFDDIDRYSTVGKQLKMLQLILDYWHLGSQAIAKGVTMVKIRRLKVVQEIARMRFSVPNDDLSQLDQIALRLERSMTQLGGIYEER